MTREEAIEMWVIPALENTWNEKRCNEVLEALEQEPCDSVSRKAAIDACLKGLNRKEMVSNIKALPSVHPECTEDYCPTAFKPVECEDCVSREEAIKAIYGYSLNIEMSMGIEQYKSQIANMLQAVHEMQKKLIEDLPSVTPAEKVGRWEWVQYDGNPNIGNWHCSECRFIVIPCVSKNEEGGIPIYKYCPICGAKMQEVEHERRPYNNIRTRRD